MTDQAKTILIVDNEPLNLRLLRACLSGAGYCLLEATHGEEALKKAEEKPDLILLDIMMPDMDGFEACRRLKEDESTREIPVIFLSALQPPKAKTMGFEAGGVDYISKPIDPKELLARVRTHLTIREQTLQLRRDGARLEKMVEERTRQLIHADRLTTLGTFSAGIAHEINNPITYVTGNVQLLKHMVGSVRKALEKLVHGEGIGQVRGQVDQMDEVLDAILRGSHRISRIVSSLKTYAKKDQTQKERCRLIDTVDDALVLLNHRLKHDVSVEMEVSPELEIFCDRQKISQVFINLIHNSVDAMENGTGKISIEAWVEEDRVSIRVRDNGPGIPEEMAPKIFEPFFTTKGKSNGTGLGLFIVRSIIQEHQGEISLRLTKGEGAEFHIVLPVSKLSHHLNIQRVDDYRMITRERIQMDFKALAKKIGLEEKEYLELLELFITTSFSDLSQLESAIENRDAQKAMAAAHSIKGAAASLELMEVFEIAKRTEMNSRENNLEEAIGTIKLIKEKFVQINDSLDEERSKLKAQDKKRR